MRILSALALFVCFVAPAFAQGKRRSANIESMVAAERAFSRMSSEKGTRESFAGFIAEDGVLFRPKPVLGKKWMQKHPLPPSSTRPLLTWQPIFAAISRAGDMGYTTGPWQYKNDIKDAKPLAFGNFMTIWKRQPDGKWKFVLDLGITNPEPKHQAKLTYAPSASGGFKPVNLAATRAEILNEDREFSKASASLGAAEAFLLVAEVHVRLFRNHKMPFVGRRAGAAALTPLSSEWTWTPAFADVSVSGDLGYSYGTYELRDKATRAVTEIGNYARVWKKIAGMWRVVIDVADPLQPEAKN